MIRIAIQAKGRLNEESIALLKEAGISIEDSKRKLLAKSEDFPIEVLYLRDDDIPQAVAMGVADLGIVGLNEVEEKNFNVTLTHKLGFGKCRISLAVPKTETYPGLEYFNGKRVATSYPAILSRFFTEKGISAEIHEIAGSVEIAPSVGMADAIFDIVSSGGTLVTNGLKEVEKVLFSEAVLIATPNLDEEKRQLLGQLLFRFEAVERSKGMKIRAAEPAARQDRRSDRNPARHEKPDNPAAGAGGMEFDPRCHQRTRAVEQNRTAQSDRRRRYPGVVPRKDDPLMQIIVNPEKCEWAALTARPQMGSAVTIGPRVAAILDAVRAEGDDALPRLTREIDGVKLPSPAVTADEIEEASRLVPQELKTAIATAKNNIERFHAAQQGEGVDLGASPGVAAPGGSPTRGFGTAFCRERMGCDLQVRAFGLLGGVEPFDIVFGRGDSRFKFLWDEARSLFGFVRGDGRPRRAVLRRRSRGSASAAHRRLRHALHRGSLPHAARSYCAPSAGARSARPTRTFRD